MKSKLQIQNIKVALFMLLMTMFSINCHSQGCPIDQSTAVFYTKASGDFSNPSIWEYQDSCGNWVEATLPPWIQNTCVIRSLNHSDVFIPQFINSLVIESGGSLTVVSDLTVSGSNNSGGVPGPAIEISGILTLPAFGKLRQTGPAAVIIHSASSVDSSGEFYLSGNMTVHGQYDGALGKLTFDGTSAQVLDHSPVPGSPPSNFGEVVFDNPSTVQVGGTGDIKALKKHSKTGHVTLLKRTAAAESFRIDAGAIVTTGLSVEVSVGGDMTVHGQYDGALGKLTFDGTSAQVLDHSPAPGSPPSNFGEVEFDNPSTVQVGGTGDINVLKKHTKTGHVTLLKRTAAAESFRIDVGGIVTTGPLVEVSVGGDMTVHGQYDGALGKLSFDGASAQVLDHSPDLGSPPSNFGEVVYDNSSVAGVTVVGNDVPFVSEKKEFKGHVTLLKRSDARQSVVIDAFGDVIFGDLMEFSVGGDWTNNGNFIPGTGTVIFNGSGDSLIGGTTSPQNFYNLEVNKGPLFKQVLIDCEMIVTNDLTVTNGRLRKFPPSLFAHNIMQRLSISPSGIFDGNSLDVSVRGDMTVHGQYDGALGKLTFDGSSAQVLDHSPVVGSPSSNFGEVVFDNPSTVQVSGTQDIDVLKKHTKSGHVTLLKRTAATESFRIDAGAIVTTGASVEVAVAGDMTVHGQYDGALGKLTFDGSSAQVLDHSPVVGSPPSNFGEVVYENPSVAGVTVLGNDVPFVSEKKEFKGHVTLLKRSDARQSVAIDSNSVIYFGSSDFSVGGDWTNNGGTFDPGTSTVIFNGTAVQKIEGVSSNFHKLTVDNLAGLEIRESPTLPRLTSVSGDLQLSNGKLYLFGGQDLQLASDANLLGASSSNYIVTTGKGSLLRVLPIDNSAVIYPIGTLTGYSPVTLKLFSTTGQPSPVGERAEDGVSSAYDTDDNPTGTAIVNRAVLKTYFATGTIPPGDYITIHPQWNAADEGLDFDRSVCDLAHYTGGQWIRSTPTAAVAGDPPGSYTGTFTATVTSLSPFAVFSQNSTSCSTLGEWTGVVSSDWSDPNNWCSGMLPTPTTNVVIPSGTSHQPTIAAGAVAGIVVGAIIATLTINSGATLTVSDNLELHLSGDMTVHGQYNGFDGKLVFDGASAQVFDHSPDATSPPSNFGELIFSNTAGGVTVIGNTIPIVARGGNREASTPSVSEVVVTKALRITGPLLINPGTLFTVTATGELSVGGDMTVHGQYNGIDGKLTFDGTSLQVFNYNPNPASPPSNFGEVIFDNAAEVNLNGTQDFILSKVYCKSASSATCTSTAKVQLSFRLSSNATFNLFPGVELSVGGDMTVHGQYNGVDGKLTFDGSSAQVLDHSPVPGSPPSNFGELVFDNPSTVQVGGTQDIDVLKKHTKTGHVTLLKRTSAAESCRIDAGGIVTTGLLVELAVGGDMTVHGQYDGALGKLTFDGSSAQVLDHSPLPGLPPSNFGEVIYDNPSVAGVTVQGNDVPFVSEKKEFKGHVTLLKRSDARQSVVIDALGDVIFGDFIEFSLGGDWTNNGGAFNPGTSTVIFNGSENSIIGGTSSTHYFNDLKVNKSSGTARVRYECAICHARTITIQSGDLDAGTTTDIFVSGDWINNGGTFLPGTGSVEFNGSVLQTIGGTVPATFHNLTVNNSFGLVEVMVAVALTGGLSLTTGKLSLLLSNDFFLSSDYSSTITGASPDRYIVTNGLSSLIHLYNASKAANFNPVGTELGYSPVSIDLGGITTQGTIKTRATNLTPAQLSSLGISEISHVSTLFTVEKDASLAFGSCAITFNWDASLATGNPALFQVIVRHPGSSLWISANVVSRTATSITIDGGSSFGEFVIGELGNSNVVNLKLFIEGYYIGGGAMASVKNNQDGVSPTDEVEDITVELHDATAPYALVDTTTAVLKTNGTAVCTFLSSPSGSFYIAVLTSNAIKTTSANPIVVTGLLPTLPYDFTTHAGMAYEDNMVNVGGGVFAFFSGDINQDEVIDGSDATDLDLDISNSEFGVRITDLNGDGSVDGSDVVYFENNQSNSVFAHFPQ